MGESPSYRTNLSTRRERGGGYRTDLGARAGTRSLDISFGVKSAVEGKPNHGRDTTGSRRKNPRATSPTHDGGYSQMPRTQTPTGSGSNRTDSRTGKIIEDLTRAFPAFATLGRLP